MNLERVPQILEVLLNESQAVHARAASRIRQIEEAPHDPEAMAQHVPPRSCVASPKRRIWTAYAQSRASRRATSRNRPASSVVLPPYGLLRPVLIQAAPKISARVSRACHLKEEKLPISGSLYTFDRRLHTGVFIHADPNISHDDCEPTKTAVSRSSSRGQDDNAGSGSEVSSLGNFQRLSSLDESPWHRHSPTRQPGQFGRRQSGGRAR